MRGLTITFVLYFFFFFVPATPVVYTLSLHDALPISSPLRRRWGTSTDITAGSIAVAAVMSVDVRSEEHTSELQSHSDLVCRLLLEKKNDYFTPIRSFRLVPCARLYCISFRRLTLLAF